MRGTGSLQALLGRDAKKRKVGSRPSSRQPAEPSEPSPKPAAGASPLRTGCVRCPVCNKQQDPQLVNEHLDKCLAAGRPARRQATLLDFAPHRGSQPPPTQPTQLEPAASPPACNNDSLEPLPSSWSSASPPTCPARPLPAAPAPTPPGPRPRSANAAPATRLHCFPCCVVGRQFQAASAQPYAPGQRLAVEAEEGNPRDAHALLVSDPASGLALGHIPHAVARHLGPLLRRGAALAEAVVAEDAAAPAGSAGAGRAPLPVEVQVTVLAATGPGREEAAAASAAGVQRAREAAARWAAAPTTTGGRLVASFAAVLATVLARDRALLSAAELGLLDSYRGLPQHAQCLFLRLLLRRGPWFRLSSLTYDEVPDVPASAAALCAAGLASDALSGATWRELTDLLPVPELAAVLAEAGGMALRGGRAVALAALGTHSALSAPAAAAVHRALSRATGPALRLGASACELVRRLERLFFLDEGQGLGHFAAAGAGGLRYPQYIVAAASPVFAARADLLAYEAALGHAQRLTDALEEEDLGEAEAALVHAWAALDRGLHKEAPAKQAGVCGSDAAGEQPLFLRRFRAGWVYTMMGTAGVSLLERQRLYEAAVERLQLLLGGWCCPSRRGDWWVRLSINLEHLGRTSSALEVAEAALADEWLGQGDRLALQRRVLRLGKPPRRWVRPTWAETAKFEPRERCIEGRPLGGQTGVKSRFYGLDGEQVGVEELALQYYASEEGGGWRGLHSEGGIWATLFGLLLWQVLFMPVPDVFRSPFQTSPLDLDTDAFYPPRREAIGARLAEIRAGRAPALLTATWEEQRGVLARGVHWDRWTLPELLAVAECVGGAGLAAVCQLLAEDHGGWSGGMPDLLLWHPQRRAAVLSEVKGPRDRLSDQQRAWIIALTAAGLEVEVLKVREPAMARGRR